MNVKLEIFCSECNIREEIKLEKDHVKDIVLFQNLNKSKKFNIRKICSSEIIIFCKKCNEQQILSL